MYEYAAYKRAFGRRKIIYIKMEDKACHLKYQNIIIRILVKKDL